MTYIGGVKTLNKPFAYRAAYNSDDNVEYEGWAMPGIAETTAEWQICKHSYTSGNLTATKWADGSGEFSFKWSTRSSYTYS